MPVDIEVTTPTDIKTVLSRNDRHGRGWRPLSSAVILILLAVAAFLSNLGGSPEARYVTQNVTTGDLTVTVTATGNLQPRNQVDIGTELSGTVRAVKVDVNDEVRRGELLAMLDTSRLNAQLLQTRSSVISAEARVLQGTSILKEASASLTRLLKVRQLSAGKLPSQQDIDAAEAAVARATGEVAVARAIVAQAQASRDAVLTDLAKAEIRSPINGVVLARFVEPGQIVAASLRSPVLFRLAEDLRQMELHVSVDEADIGAVRVGQPAVFTVDAFPSSVFEARVAQVHMASSQTHDATSRATRAVDQMEASASAVVTYETVLEVENSELTLRPGMTATAEIMITNLTRIVLVPNAAMRFTPDKAQLPDMSNDRERRTGMMALVPHFDEQWSCPRENGQALGCVWVLENGRPALALFKPGATDRSMTQVFNLDQLPNWSVLSRLRNDEVLTRAVQRELAPGMQVVVDSKAPRHTDY